MTELNREELSLNMRIPADLQYLDNAVLTLEGICDHFSIEVDDCERIAEALKKALSTSIDFSFQQRPGLFDLKFSVFNDKLQITVEDFMVDTEVHDKCRSASEVDVKVALAEVEELVDNIVVYSEIGRNSCYSMQFKFDKPEAG